jgi:acyl carrier protein
MSPEPSVLNTLEERVVAIITKQKRLQPGQVTIDSTFADLSIDSLDGMELVFEFEEAFDLTISDAIAREMQTVRQAVDTLRQAITTSPPDPATPTAVETPPHAPADRSSAT